MLPKDLATCSPQVTCMRCATLQPRSFTSLLLSVQVTYQSTLAGCCCPHSGLKPPVTRAASPNRPPDQIHHPSPYRPIQCDRIRT
ncbi:hypothetical protein ROHU_010467 [Labeo rohita]|uniref:Uncharacterized protein n=1 Tax=Labeo rohita TaxID=84645 RepID=A0A498LU67_LABRO|nr:hypothetical protein ROHU_010467 [Labeo rohita]